MTVPLILLTLILLVVITRPFTVIFHELGHGIPALLLTKDKVTLYIGSYGDPKHSLTFRIGRLEFFFKYNPFLWKLGLCIPHSKEVTINRQIFITVFGPVTSLFLGAVGCYTAFAGDFHGSIKLISVVLLGSSAFDFFINIVPRDEPIELFDGSIVHNDGQQLRQLFKYKTLDSKYTVGADHYNKQEYEIAAKAFHNIIDNGLRNDMVYRLAISAYLQFKDYKTALTLHEEFEKYCNLNSDDYANSGLIKSQLGSYYDGMHDYQKSLDVNPKNKYALNNRGYTYNLLELYDQAIADFNKAIQIEPKFAYSFNNRGLAKIKLGQVDEGLRDIKTSMDLDDKNSYAYRNLGIYHYDKGDFAKALEHFEKAYELDKDTHLITEYIDKTKEKLKRPAHNNA
ncbi:tetratricopeptide repeat protein [Nonlabens xiamenensis]|uniref:tetratricopeptide repeat protein n=1 Tax=Nonlabens xiamenensis TaxID=2341043 RepID=UPI000F604C1E|nr:tetratricopeptide repeat protein [Nonlabens xiamenensis]